MYSAREIREVHLEVTSKCNVHCPMCARNEHGQINQRLPLTELSLDAIRSILPATFVQQLHTIYLCGNYGDPIVARDTLSILSYLRSLNPDLLLTIHTHGSGRRPDFWQRLASLGVRVHFSIDGLEETNAIYRRGTDWARIMRSIEAFTSAGGRAYWDFIVFRHNEHQVEEARGLADRLGFARFSIKKTNRFFRGGLVSRKLDGRPELSVDPAFPVLSDAGEVVSYLELPLGAANRNPGMKRVLKKGFRSLRDHTRISCRSAADRSVYISAEGLVFPCCYLANIYAPGTDDDHPVLAMLRSLDGKSTIQAPELSAIVEGPFFAEIVSSWSRPTVASGRLKTCARVCGDRSMYAEHLTKDQ